MKEIKVKKSTLIYSSIWSVLTLVSMIMMIVGFSTTQSKWLAPAVAYPVFTNEAKTLVNSADIDKYEGNPDYIEVPNISIYDSAGSQISGIYLSTDISVVSWDKNNNNVIIDTTSTDVYWQTSKNNPYYDDGQWYETDLALQMNDYAIENNLSKKEDASYYPLSVKLNSSNFPEITLDENNPIFLDNQKNEKIEFTAIQNSLKENQQLYIYDSLSDLAYFSLAMFIIFWLMAFIEGTVFIYHGWDFSIPIKKLGTKPFVTDKKILTEVIILLLGGFFGVGAFYSYYLLNKEGDKYVQ